MDSEERRLARAQFRAYLGAVFWLAFVALVFGLAVMGLLGVALRLFGGQ